MFYEEITRPFLHIILLIKDIFYNSKFILMARLFVMNAVIAMRVHCIHLFFFFPGDI